MDWLKKLWNWVRTDGLLHISLVGLALLTFANWMPLWAANVLAVVIFMTKELIDLFSKEGTAEWHDVICDLVGLAYGNLVVCFGWLLSHWL